MSLLREAGAIPFVRTNVPQGLMVPESMSVTWGTTLNPWNWDSGRVLPVADLAFVMRAARLAPRMWQEDPFVPRLPLDEAAISGASGPAKLRIAYYETEGWFIPAPACAWTISRLCGGRARVRAMGAPSRASGREDYGLLVANPATSILQAWRERKSTTTTTTCCACWAYPRCSKGPSLRS